MFLLRYSLVTIVSALSQWLWGIPDNFKENDVSSQAWGGCEEQAAGGVSLEAAQLPGYRQTDCELETLLEDQGWGSSRGRSVGGLLGTR